MQVKGERQMLKIIKFSYLFNLGIQIKVKPDVLLPMCLIGLWVGVASAQTMPDQQASNTTLSTRHQFANPSAADKALAKQVRRQLARTKGVDASEVLVGVKNGAVLLRGRLDDAEQRERVESVVRVIPGVKSVDNQLTVQPTN
jgi:hyperosmotically inducible periplasmic protein